MASPLKYLMGTKLLPGGRHTVVQTFWHFRRGYEALRERHWAQGAQIIPSTLSLSLSLSLLSLSLSLFSLSLSLYSLSLSLSTLSLSLSLSALSLSLVSPSLSTEKKSPQKSPHLEVSECDLEGWPPRPCLASLELVAGFPPLAGTSEARFSGNSQQFHFRVCMTLLSLVARLPLQDQAVRGQAAGHRSCGSGRL